MEPLPPPTPLLPPSPPASSSTPHTHPPPLLPPARRFKGAATPTQGGGGSCRTSVRPPTAPARALSPTWPSSASPGTRSGERTAGNYRRRLGKAAPRCRGAGGGAGGVTRSLRRHRGGEASPSLPLQPLSAPPHLGGGVQRGVRGRRPLPGAAGSPAALGAGAGGGEGAGGCACAGAAAGRGLPGREGGTRGRGK